MPTTPSPLPGELARLRGVQHLLPTWLVRPDAGCDLVGDVVGVASDAGQHVRGRRVLELQAHEVQAGLVRHDATSVYGTPVEAEDVEVDIDPNELDIETFRSTGPGGQSVNTTDSAVRITHRPTGTVVSMQDEKSQLQNRQKAMRVLRARLYERALAEQRAEIEIERRAQVGTGERSEKVRTYNFPQARVTDHRVKHTSHDLDEVLNGDLSEFTDALSAEERRRRLEAQAAEA